MEYHDMKKYMTERDAKGNATFGVPLKPDEDGMIGRECSNAACETKYFKVASRQADGETSSTGVESGGDHLTCPYCGEHRHFQKFHTRAQIDWVMSMARRDVSRVFHKMLDDAFRPFRHSGPGAGITVESRRGPLPAIRHYVEEKLRQVVACDTCRNRYAVYGISLHCPRCGKGTFTQHLTQSVRTVRVLAEEADRLGESLGVDIRDRMYGNAYGDVVGLFEGFLKQLYRYAVKRRYPTDEAERLLAGVKVNFQRLKGAADFFERDLGVRLFDGLGPDAMAKLEMVFAKRHVLTHNLGLADGKYRDQAQAWARPGTEIPLDQAEIIDALGLVERIVALAGQTLTQLPA